MTVFISYSWDSENHKDWVRKLADYLIGNGLDVFLDQYELAAGKNMTYFMESAIESSDKVLIVMTPNYKKKAQLRQSGVGFEYSIITSELFSIQANNKKFLPILRSEKKEESIPTFLKSLIYHPMTSDDLFHTDAFNLLRIICDKPEIKKPIKGKIPDFEMTKTDPILELATSVSNLKDLAQRKSKYIHSDQPYFTFKVGLSKAFNSIEKKCIGYKEQTNMFFKATYKEDRLILIIEGLSLNIYHEDKLYDFMENRIHISIWDKPISLNDRFYFPHEQPKQIYSTILKPIIDDNLDILWSDNSIKFKIDQLDQISFSLLLKYVKRKI